MKDNSMENGALFEGMVSVRALIDAQKEGLSDRKIRKLFYARSRREKQNKEYLYLSHRAQELGFDIDLLPLEEISEMATGNSHGGVLALCTGRTLPVIQEKDLVKNGFYMMMEGIEDPYNFGYALRSIYAAGADGVIFMGKTRTGADGTVCRSSAGASERMRLFTSEPEECVALFKRAGYMIAASDTENARPVYEVSLRRPVLLVVGGEKRGISASLLSNCDAVVRLEYGRFFDAALSAASAASILAFEVFRQNRENG